MLDWDHPSAPIISRGLTMKGSSRFNLKNVARKQAIFEAMLEQKGLETSSLQKITPRSGTEATEPVPLSFAQQRLWLIDQLLPNSAAYNLVIALSLSGPL